MSEHLVIVAIPAADEPVWKMSSEKIPHLTLLFLGEAENNPNINRIFSFVHHAAQISEHGPFYMEVDYRGVLGDDQADVLFFSKRDWSYKWVETFRNQLLQNTDIRAAYESTEQFPEWQPHLTLGYPEAPAKERDDDRSIYSVHFDRIAVWTGNYEGPEFRLKWPERELTEVMMSGTAETGEAAVADILHYGTKGMKWGVRKGDVGAGANSETMRAALLGNFALLSPTFRAHTSEDTKVKVGLFGQYALLSKDVRADLEQASKKVAVKKADSEWEKGLGNGSAWVAVNNASADHFNAHIDGVNARHPESKRGDWSTDIYNPSTPAQKKYMDEIYKLTRDSIEHANNTLQTTNPSGTKKVTAEQDPDEPLTFRMRVETVKHADDNSEIISFRIAYKTGIKGLVNGFTISDDDPIGHALELGEEFMEHFGTKGMKWGVRKQQLSGAARATGRGVARGAKATGRGLGKAANALGDHFWQESVYSSAKHVEIHNKVANEIDSKVYKLQTAPKYRGKNLKADKKLADEYEQDVAKVTDAAYRKAVKDTYGNNVTGTKTANYVNDVRGSRIEVRDRVSGEKVTEVDLSRIDNDLAQSALAHVEKAPDLTIHVKLDSNGQIAAIGRVKLDAEAMAQTATTGEEFLEHYGIKGMRWGQRNADRPAPVAKKPTATSIVPHGEKKKTKIKTEGGENHDASPDAIKVAQAKAKLAKSGTAALSNAELREVATRLQLEQQVKQMTAPAGRKFISNLLKTQGQNELNTRISVNRQQRLAPRPK